MVFTTQPGPEVVRLWNLVPAEIGQAELADAVSTRLLPAVTDDDAGDVLRVDDDGNWEVGAPFTVAATAPDGSVSAGQLLARFPEFALGGAAERNGGQVNNALAESYRMAGSSNTAQMWCAAHLLALVGEQTGSPDGGAGVVTSETLGPHSVSLMVDAAGSREAFFATTTYGRMLLSIESRTPKVAVGIVFA